MSRATLLTLGAPDSALPPSSSGNSGPKIAEPGVTGAFDCEALLLSQALGHAESWHAEILSAALAALGDIDLPEPRQRTLSANVLAILPALYWVYGLSLAGLLQTAETVAGLWASGTIQVPLPDHGALLQKYWGARRERLSERERDHILEMVFDPRDFLPSMRRVCEALVSLADNAQQHDIREEVGLAHAAASLLDLCAARLEGAPLFAAPDLLAQTKQAVQLLAQRQLQTAFAVHDFYSLIDLNQAGRGARAGQARELAEHAQAGAAVLRWLAGAAMSNFAVDPKAEALQTLMAQAQRWLVTARTAAALSPVGTNSRANLAKGSVSRAEQAYG